MMESAILAGGRWLLLALAVLFPQPATLSAEDASKPTRNYYAYVAAESEDQVELIRFGPGGLEVAKSISVGSFPADIEGPHGISVSPDGKHWFVSIAHGMPYGSIHKYETGTDDWVGDVTVGMFPATLAVSPSTGLLYVVNFNLHGDMEPSSISVVEVETMIEVAQISTGIMPHGARLDAKGARLYSVNMMSDELMEFDALRFEVNRRLSLVDHDTESGEMHEHGEGHESAYPMSKVIQPTWVTPPTPQGKVYVAGNAKDVVLEVDLEDWKVTRKFETGPGPYNLDVTPDGKVLVATYKKGAAVGFWNLETGQEIASVPSSRRVPHGVVVTSDGKYALVTVEGVGGEPGSVDVFEIATPRLVASVDVGKQAGGIALWEGER